jgi:hypothetical protein
MSDTKDWRLLSLSFSLEALRDDFPQDVDFLEANHSVGISPSATAGLLYYAKEPSKYQASMDYLLDIVRTQPDGGAPNSVPVEILEIVWSLNYLRSVGAIHPNHPEVQRALRTMWPSWSNECGFSSSRYFSVPDLDDTASAFPLFNWGGYPVSAEVFAYYEREDRFCCYPHEATPSLSVNIRTYKALQSTSLHSKSHDWTNKALNMVRQWSSKGNRWYDKWNSSPYYLICLAVTSMHQVNNVEIRQMLRSRIDWLLHAQQWDGGWGNSGFSIVEETAYGLLTLLFWDRHVERIERSCIQAAADYLIQHIDDTHIPLWIGKSLYGMPVIARSAILAALYMYLSSKT